MFLPLLLLAVQTDAATAPAADVKPEKKVCRRMEAPTGSIMPAKAACHTKTEWAAIDGQHAHDGDALNAAGSRDTMRGTGH
jgi:hypothetical protein